MTAAQFLETRGPAWTRFEDMLGKTARGLSGLSEDELHELVDAYPSIVVDVARARMYKLSPETQQRVNRLAIAAHGLLYRKPSRRPWKTVGRFVAQDYPRLFRELWVYMVLATAIFLIAGTGAFVVTQIRPSTAYLFVPGDLDLPDGRIEVTAEDISERFRRMPQPPMAAGIITNNISVAFNAFALGMTAGVGTCYLVLFNAMMVGGIAGHFVNHGLTFEFCSFIAPHGCLEILTILIAAAAGMRLGLSIVLPGSLTRKASLRAGAAQAVLLVLGTVPMFVLAGLIEGFITPSHLPGELKIGLGIAVAAGAMAYLLFVGRETPVPTH